MAAKADAPPGRKLLALAAAASSDVVDDDPHGQDGITGRRATTQ
jgi:hypothetical protein